MIEYFDICGVLKVLPESCSLCLWWPYRFYEIFGFFKITLNFCGNIALLRLKSMRTLLLGLGKLKKLKVVLSCLKTSQFFEDVFPPSLEGGNAEIGFKIVQNCRAGPSSAVVHSMRIFVRPLGPPNRHGRPPVLGRRERRCRCEMGLAIHSHT